MQVGQVSGHALRIGGMDISLVAQSLRQKSGSGSMGSMGNHGPPMGRFFPNLPGMGLKFDGLSNREDEPCARLFGLLERYPTAGGAAPDVEDRLR